MNASKILLIHPPVVKPSEPPPGVALLAGTLRHYGVLCSVWDANVEALTSELYRDAPPTSDKRVQRGRRHRDQHLRLLRCVDGYANLDRYKRAVLDLNRVLEANSAVGSLRAGLANLLGDALLPVRSKDLLYAAEHPDQIPFYQFYQERLCHVVETSEPTVVGVSLNFMSQALCAFALIGMLRSAFSHIEVVVGGGLVTSWMRRPGWRNPFAGLIDVMVDGPGEETLLALVGIESPSHQPVPADFQSMDWDGYLAPGPILPFSGSSGCYWNRCAFCPEKAEGNPYRPLEPRRAVEHLGHHIRTEQPALIHFLDNAMSPSLLKVLCRYPLPVPWYGFVRVSRELADPDFCRELKNAGCVMLKLGIESGSQEVLDGEGKGIEVKIAERALRCLKEAGILTYVYLLFGTPTETEGEARKTLDFSVRNSPYIDFLNCAIFNLPVTGEPFARLQTYEHYDGDLSLYAGFEHPRGWHRGLVRHFLDRDFKRQPALAAILRRDPPVFTSNHAPFLGASFQGSG